MVLEFSGEGEPATETELSTLIVKVDGETVEAENYEIILDDNGNITIRLSAEYMKKLLKGRHLLSAEFANSIYSVTVEIV